MKKAIPFFLMVFLFSCIGNTMEQKISTKWAVDKMKRNVGDSFQNMVVNPKMSFEFEENGEVKIVTHLGMTIRGTWGYMENEKTIQITAENETKNFVIDSISDKRLYLTSNDVKFHLKKWD